MDIDKLSYFCAVVKAGSLRRASEILKISSPALSKAIHILEEELGMELLVKSGRGIVISEAGKMLAARAESVLKDIDEMKKDLRNDSQKQKPLRICTFEVFSTYFLEAFNFLPWEDRPLILHELIPGELEHALSQGLCDLGITYMPIAHPDIDFLKVTQIEMGVYTRNGAFPGIKQDELPYVVPVNPLFGAPTRIKGLDGWPDDAYQRKVKYQVTLMESALELCRQGKAAGYFPVFIVEAHNTKLRPKYQLERRHSPYQGRKCFSDVFIAKRRSTQETSEIKQVAKAIRMFCK